MIRVEKCHRDLYFNYMGGELETERRVIGRQSLNRSSSVF